MNDEVQLVDWLIPLGICLGGWALAILLSGSGKGGKKK